MRAFRACCLTFIASTTWLAAAPAVAQNGSPDAATRRGPTDPAELQAFLDGVMAAYLSGHHIAGATVAVVRDGRILLTRGYGLADVAAREPVDPARTLFRIGSITKLFTWTAVMQLVEQGKLDLDRDLETWLDFEIPDAGFEPITLRHLLTHTPGFEEDGRDQEAASPDDNEPMREWLPDHIPARVRPPGTFSAYSNWGAAAAGYIVERVSGIPFEEYLERHILSPLGMHRTTARQPLPERFADDMSHGYGWEGGAFVSKPWEVIKGAAPAGSMSSTAADMATWMLAHLGGGRVGDARILADETAALMHRRSFSHDPRINGWALGFYEKSSNGLRIIGHGGGSRWFHTDLALVPDERLGVFVSFNTSTGGEVAFGPFLDAFLDHYYPESPPPRVTHGGLDRFVGTYRFNRMSYTTFQKAMSLPAALPVRALGDTALVVRALFGDARFVPVDSMLFRERAGSMVLAFRAGDDGAITHGFLSMAPMMVMERQPWYLDPALHGAILGGGLAAFAGILVAAAARRLRQRRGVEPAAPRRLAVGRRVLAVAALANMSFVVLFLLVAGNEQAFLSAQPTALRVALAFPVVGLVCLLAAVWFVWRLWRERAGTTWERMRFTAMVAVAALFAWSLHTWNLLGWRM